MGIRRLREWWPLGVVAGFAVIAGWLLYLLFRSWGRDDLLSYSAFALAVVVLVVGWLARAWRKTKAFKSPEVLGQAADRLATVVQAQWRAEAEKSGLTGAGPVRVTWGRRYRPMVGMVTVAAESHRFGPLPGLTLSGEADLTAGEITDLYALYGGLGSGRLVITGPPGSGKTSAAVLLVLDALRHRDGLPADQRSQVPVPVLFTTYGWDPRRQSAVHWLVEKLQDTYPLLGTRAGAAAAAALLDSARITVILDGLDEISPELRPVALQALSRQATFRLVILSRTGEIAAAAVGQDLLQGAAVVELNPVGPADAASYLERSQLYPAPAGWHELTTRIRAFPNSPLSRALDSPLALTLVRDTYQAEGTLSGLLELCDALDGLPADQAAEAITGHLLDQVLPAAYASRPGQPPPPYDLPTAQRTLIKIAVQMNKEGTRDLNWWRIPSWAPRAPRALASAGVPGLVSGVLFWLAVRPESGLVSALMFGLGAGLAAGLLFGFAAMGGDRPRSLGHNRPGIALTRESYSILLAGVPVAGLVAGLWLLHTLMAGRLMGTTLIENLALLALALPAGIASGFYAVLAVSYDSGSSINPTDVTPQKPKLRAPGRAHAGACGRARVRARFLAPVRACGRACGRARVRGYVRPHGRPGRH